MTPSSWEDWWFVAFSSVLPFKHHTRPVRQCPRWEESDAKPCHGDQLCPGLRGQKLSEPANHPQHTFFLIFAEVWLVLEVEFLTLILFSLQDFNVVALHPRKWEKNNVTVVSTLYSKGNQRSCMILYTPQNMCDMLGFVTCKKYFLL